MKPARSKASPTLNLYLSIPSPPCCVFNIWQF
nr:MAG TPA: hypothetical protein [Bacteriophage sp.]DAX11611.1 MAG TPA: hypothetical protein [Bacteriophage sp.]